MALFNGQKALVDIIKMCKITSVERNDNFTIYMIRIEIDSYFWTVGHRYSEFFDLNEKLISHYNLDKSILPPKKLIGNQSDTFVKKRQTALESYLHNSLHFYLSQNMQLPVAFCDFLDFKKYEVKGITQTLAESFYHYGDSILAAGSLFTLTPLHLSSITKRMTLAEPTFVSEDRSKDLGHLLDFASQLVRLHIEGNNATIGSSNLVMNRLLFDLSCFKSVKELQIYNCDLKSLKGVGSLRSTLQKVNVKNSIQNLHDLLLCDVLHWPPDETEIMNSCWMETESVQFCHNKLQKIDISMRLLVNVKNVDLSYNHLSEINNLEVLSKLINLNLSHNLFVHLENLHTKLGNIRSLNLSSNKITELHGLSKLYSLESLDLSNNKVDELSEIQHLSKLPCLEALKLINNPVVGAVDYRIKTLAVFAPRINEISLDGIAVTQKEKDTVAVIHAIKVSKESSKEKLLQPTSTRSTTHEVPLPSAFEEKDDSPSSSDNPESFKRLSISNESNSERDENSTEISEFKHQIEIIRKQGGSSWLRLLNTMQDINKAPEDESESSKHESSYEVEVLVPNFSLLYPESCISHISTAIGYSLITNVFWCISISKLVGTWLSRLPACVAFAQEILFILQITSMPENKPPVLVLKYKVPVKRIQSVTRSFYGYFVKISALNEERVICNHYLLLNECNEALVISGILENDYGLNVQVEDPICSSSLTFELSKKSKSNDGIKAETVYHQRVALCHAKSIVEKNTFHWISMTKSHLILAMETFDYASNKTVFQHPFSSLVIVPINSIVAQFNMYDNNNITSDPQPPSSTTSTIPSFFYRFGYQLNIKFVNKHQIDIRFPSKETRNLFLETFTQLRQT